MTQSESRSLRELLRKNGTNHVPLPNLHQTFHTLFEKNAQFAIDALSDIGQFENGKLQYELYVEPLYLRLRQITDTAVQVILNIRPSDKEQYIPLATLQYQHDNTTGQYSYVDTEPLIPNKAALNAYYARHEDFITDLTRLMEKLN